jgi:hypothetical protein
MPYTVSVEAGIGPAQTKDLKRGSTRRLLLACILFKRGYRVESAGGREAIELFKSESRWMSPAFRRRLQQVAFFSITRRLVI